MSVAELLPNIYKVRGFYVMIKYNNMDDIKDLRWMVR